MKTVSGEAVSSKSISLKKAAKTLSNFASSDNGASPAFAAYLKRAVASFNELVQLHKESKRSGGEYKVKKRRSTDIASEVTVGSIVNCADESLMKEIGANKRKERKGMNKTEGESGRVYASAEVQKLGVIDGYVTNVGGAVKKSKKKRENETVTIKNETYENVDKKKRAHGGKEHKNEGKLEIEVANNKESKKRKHESTTTTELDGSQEQHMSKKKKR